MLRALMLALVLGSLIVGGCTAPAELASVFGPPTPAKDVVRQPRRTAYRKPKPPPLVKVEEEKPRTDWEARLKELPEHPNGGPDWVRALAENLITPKAGLDDKAEDQPVLDIKVELTPKDMPEFKATFPHQPHTQILACTNCHTDIFQMEAGADPISMDKIFAGQYCGRCHGKVAFDVATGCPRCHLQMPK